MPSLTDLGFSKEDQEMNQDPSSSLEFKGGEDEGLKRVHHYIWTIKALDSYKQTRNEIFGPNYSSKLSPWLACGAISPRFVYHETKRYEQAFNENDSTKHFIMHLFVRDFYRWYCYKHGNRIFFEYGALDKQQQWEQNIEIINRWKNGTTGIPIIDAFMRELNLSGFMSNRGRQIVASFLTLDLKQDWRFGAYHFEEKLIDHDVHSNYGSWNCAVGLGPSKVLHFNVIKQSQDFDK